MQCSFDTVCNHSTCHLLPYSSFILILQLYFPLITNTKRKRHTESQRQALATRRRELVEIFADVFVLLSGRKVAQWPLTFRTSSNLSAWTSGARSEVPLASRSGWWRPQSSWEHSVEFNYFHMLHRQMCVFLFHPYHNWTQQHGNISFMEKLRHFHFVVTFNATLQTGPTSSSRALTQTEVTLGSNSDEHSF